jgi:uncharacterized membrane protein
LGLLITECDASGKVCRFIIRPNNSLGTTGKIIFFMVVCLVSVGLAIRFWLLGAWLVMPVVLLEMIVLGVAFYLVDRAARDIETIDLSEDSLKVTRSVKSVVDEWRFQPYWVQVVLRSDRIAWYPSHLSLRSHGKSIEIGTCLTDEEREELSLNLKEGLRILKPVDRI